ncbi:MAG TPA: cation diffusion facilitator family transporter [Anaerolineales bacterium]|nr:cation diffusion facilitator family transporter [Anaerolineales bacterium]HNO30991.1 cation diffusion facilitator family transporter [Anaerolineales bacterium]
MTHERERKSLIAVNLGLGVNVFLAIVKTTFGVLGHSPALLAEGINSTSDVAYYIAASIFVRMANKPADSDHPYGHRQFESIGSLLIGSFVITTALAVFWDAVDKIWDFADGVADFTTSHPFALYVALGTVVIKIFLTRYIRRLGRETQNPVVDALAFDHRNDLFSASAATVGIFLGQRGFPWVDPLAGALVAVLIFRTGLFILRESSTDLMAIIPSRDLAQRISDLMSGIDGVTQLEELQAHRFGPHIVVNLTIGIDGALSVFDGDRIASSVEEVLLLSVPNVRRVHVHYHPAVSEHAGMTIDQILEPHRKYNAPHHPEYYE